MTLFRQKKEMCYNALKDLSTEQCQKQALFVELTHASIAVTNDAVKLINKMASGVLKLWWHSVQTTEVCKTCMLPDVFAVLMPEFSKYDTEIDKMIFKK